MAGNSDTVAITLDEPQQQSFLSFFETLPQKTTTTIRIFDRNDYYTVHGQDAIFAAKEIFKTTGVIKFFGSGDKRLESVTLNQLKFQSFVRVLLLVRQYRIEIYKNNASGKNQDWRLEHVGSPGNLTEFEDLLFGNAEMETSAGVMAIKVGFESGQRVVGIAYTDAGERKFVVSEFTDSDDFSNLGVILVQLGPKECLIPPLNTIPNYKKFNLVMERSKVLITERKKAEFTEKDIVTDLDKLLKFKKGEKESSSTLAETENIHAMCALSAVIKYFDLLSESIYFGQYKLCSYNLKQYVHLDSAVVKSLNLFPAPNDYSKLHSIYGILNKCRTAPGQRLLAHWIKQPLTDINKIEERLDVVEAFVDNNDLRTVLYENHLQRIPDFQRLSKKLLRKTANLQDCYRIYQAIDKIPNLLEDLETYSGKHKPVFKSLFCDSIKELIMDFMKYQEMIETTMDLSQIDNNEYLIKPEFDENLTSLREKMDLFEKEIKQQLNKVARDLNLEAGKTVKLESNSQIGYFFRITRKEEKVLRNNKSYITIDTNKNGIRFHNSSLQSLNGSYVEVREEYCEHQKAIVAEIISISAGYSEPLQQLSNVLGHLDVLVSFAVSALSSPASYVRPKIFPKGSGKIRFLQARHPCLELQDDMSFIPNDVNFTKDKEMFHIITGPNMGGKSTYIRTVGVLVLMAQIGCYVPCDEAEISIVDCIMARVGAGDCQIKGVSTFMTEMLEISSILEAATCDSLIIIDELGRGTSTYDGFGLAWAISKHLAVQIGAFCLFATHFHELTALADEVSTVNNLHVTAKTSNDTLTFLYKVKQGVCDRSFGIHIAEMAHFPQRVIENAKCKAEELEDFSTESIAGTELEGDSDSAVIKRKAAKQEGKEIIDNFLNTISNLNRSNLSNSELSENIEKLKMEIQSKNNAYVNSILSQSHS